MICPHCNHTIREEERYLMSTDPEKPGLLGSLRGEAGDPWRLFVTVALCVLFVLIITGASVALRHVGAG